MSKDRLDALGERIELLSTDPSRVRSRWASLVRPILRIVRWEPGFAIDATLELVRALRASNPASSRAPLPELTPLDRALSADPEGDVQRPPRAPLPELVKDALGELEDNVTSAERACVVKGYLPTSRAAWLRRLYEVIARASSSAEDRADKEKKRLAAAIDPVMILPPLTARRAADAPPKAAPSEPDKPSDAGPRASPEIDPGDARLLELHLAAIDHLLDAARFEAEFMGRRRRLLEASRKLLLETSAALPLDPTGVEARRAHIAEQIVRINRLEAAGVSPHVGLTHQAKTALSRGDRRLLNAALAGLDMVALQRGDVALSRSTSAALRKLWGRRSPSSPAARAASIERSAEEVLGRPVLESVRSGYDAAREDLKASAAKATPDEAGGIQALRDYLGRGGEDATLAAALAVDGCFDVGGVLSPVRVEELEERVTVVTHPTQELMLVAARDVADVTNAIIDDPRRVMLSLAEGRLLSRKFIRRETVARRTTRLVGEARIYLLDGSDSMRTEGDGRANGARARMRDAILLAELATLHKRYLAHGKRAQVSLYYRYFTRVLWPVVKVDSADAATAAMMEVIRTPRRGGTDIEGALIASFKLVRQATAEGTDLARAQIVLITDGDAPVREEVIRKERERMGSLPVGVSVIALGEENPSLRAIVARQRARGERAFYHFIDDRALRAIAEGHIDAGPALHLDMARERDRARPASEVAAELEREMGDLLDEISDLGKKRHASVLDAEALAERAMASAREEVGLPASSSISEGERARREALDRDQRSLERRFNRWFPRPAEAPGPRANATPGASPAVSGREPQAPPPAGAPERADIDAITIALSTVAEVVSDVGGGPLARQADAIEILERLLPDARLSPATYLAVLAAYPTEVAPLLQAVRAAVKPRAS